MNEVTKLYKNAGIKKEVIPKYYGYDCTRNNWDDEDCSCGIEGYPPFTAEKQLELFKLIANRLGYPDYEYFGTLLDDYVQVLNFDEALAKIVNNLWQDLTEAEKVQIKEILSE